MSKNHAYTARIAWTGNTGTGNADYRGYTRNWQVETEGKPVISCSNDPLLGGDATLHNPEDMLISALASCHMLWYLHLANAAGIVVTNYVDDPVGMGEVSRGGAGRFLRAVLRPKITLAAGMDAAAADAIHGQIHEVCFIARSVNFPVTFEATYEIETE
ncbi:MAG: OsmC family protein [Rhodobacterales bacterium]|nr:OsmC family protein [Rhodobacterales bacterium]